MQITETKNYDTRRRSRATRPERIQRPPVWRPEPSSLTRDELRQIVLDTLG